MELTAHRTLALRDAVANNPHVAMTALLHKLVVDSFQRTSSTGGCLEATVRHVFFNVQPADLKDSPSAKSVADRHEAWKTDIPQDDQTLWDWLTALDDASRLALLAHCVSYGVNALHEKADRYGGPGISQHELNRRLGQADRLAQAVRLDMIEAGWRRRRVRTDCRVVRLPFLNATVSFSSPRKPRLLCSAFDVRHVFS
jgi:ParB family chromosome partitioning protein